MLVLSLLPTAPFLCCHLCGAIERPLTFLCVCLITNLITNEVEHPSADRLAMSPVLGSICSCFSCIHTHVLTVVMERSSQPGQPRFCKWSTDLNGAQRKTVAFSPGEVIRETELGTQGSGGYPGRCDCLPPTIPHPLTEVGGALCTGPCSFQTEQILLVHSDFSKKKRSKNRLCAPIARASCPL